MKIGIITLPFNWNYGGILQTYALQSALKKLGHDSYTINRNTAPMSLKMKVLSYVRRSILKVLFRKDVVVRTWPTKEEEKTIRQHTDRFIQENVKTTDLFRSEKDFKNIGKYDFQAFVTGSDQVWRPKYSPVLENHFLGFLPKDSQAKRIAYAASFGVDNWEFSGRQTEACASLAQKFDTISVREDSAVELCKDKLNVESIVALDPTMLIDKEEYIALVEKDKIPKLKGSLLNYILDLTPDKKKIVDEAAEELKIKPVSIMPKGIFREMGKKRLEDCVCPPVTNWLRGFMDAEFVVTDSFHGTVFSIIFNKPFIAIGNAKRGITRFSSLLKILGLEDRLVLGYQDNISEMIKTPIDYQKVNTLLEGKKKEALQFLENSLNVN
ncbi:polysaccharide pyruvyl transferase family protein [Marinifilum caeruleilacunae]|nr:polysaccharide pyruvyl transferase family protein [Marinifilum caeruleilacunae]